MKRKFLFSLLAIALVCALSVPALAASAGTVVNQITGNNNTIVFIDVPSTHWAANEINSFSQQGIISGYEDGSFKPSNGVTREEFCKLLVTTFDQPLSVPEEPTFSDVVPSRWSYPYVEVCKDFLTGYANPFGGRPAFHPADFATREDIAVALVRMMGFRDSDANNQSYALQRFGDGAQISPQLLGYVSLACERGLINGYEDGTFRPAASVSRAEIVVLLNRALKQAVTNIEDDLQASAAVLYTPDGRTATITITAEEGSTVTVNGQAVSMSRVGNEYKGSYVYQFPSEGTRDFSVVVTRMGKTKVIPVTAKYEIGAPVIELTSCPTVSETASVTIRGTLTDKTDDHPSLTVNGKSIDVWSRSWSAPLTLQEGENPVVITATNKLGKSTTLTRTIVLSSGGPVVEISSCPVTSDTATVTVRGTVKDTNDAYPTVTVNGKDAGASYGRWSREVPLQEGVNTIVVVATNKLGKSTTVTRTVEYAAGGPKLTVTSCPVTSDTATITVSGTVQDASDAYPTVTVNGKDAGAKYGRWSRQVQLQEGDNTITIAAINQAGKTTTVTRSVSYIPEGPKLEVTSCPLTTTPLNSTVTIEGRVSDPTGGKPVVMVNGVTARLNYSTYTQSGTWRCSVPLRNIGANDVTIVATNAAGRSTTVRRTITMDYDSPKIDLNTVPPVTDQPTVTISGTAYTPNTNVPVTVTINGEQVDASYLFFSKTCPLEPGANTFEIVATNANGKSVSLTRTVEYIP